MGTKLRKRFDGPSLAAAAAALAVLAAAPGASAFCRSTTCRSSGGKECATDENGCPAEGAKLFWPTSCISYAVNELGTQSLDPEDTRSVIRKTFEAWTDVACGKSGVASMAFQERDPVSCKKSEYNDEGRNLNVVFFQDDNWNFRSTDRTIAKTSVTYNFDTGEIYDADIEINTANNIVTTTDDPRKVEYDLQAVLTHEVGHFIGIAHSDDASSVMYASYSPGSTAQRKLTKDDVAAVCAVYPPESGLACNVEPKGGFSASCDDEEKGGVCSVSAVGRDTTSGSAEARSMRAVGLGQSAFGMIGFGAVVATRLLRRSKRIARRS